MVKPFSMLELLLRVRGMLRRSSRAADDTVRGVVSAGDLGMDPDSHTVRRAGAILNLNPREYALLPLVITNTGKMYACHEILDRVWGQDYAGDIRTVDVHVR